MQPELRLPHRPEFLVSSPPPLPAAAPAPPLPDGHTRPRPDRAALGARGEELAVEHLQEHDLVVLDRNWRCRHGELDVVATDGRTLVVVEVKTRSGRGYGRAEESVTPAKLARMRRLAQVWLSTHHVRWVEVRFDVVGVEIDRQGDVRLVHLEGVF